MFCSDFSTISSRLPNCRVYLTMDTNLTREQDPNNCRAYIHISRALRLSQVDSNSIVDKGATSSRTEQKMYRLLRLLVHHASAVFLQNIKY
jgi:hypothetical protein